MNPPSSVAREQIADFCRRWKVSELALFGSVLRPDFHTDSDIDVLVTFEATTEWSLLDLATMRQELGELFGRPVDLVEEAGLRNPYRGRAILETKQILYAA